MAKFHNKKLKRKIADIKPVQHINRPTGNKSRNFVLTKNRKSICSDAGKLKVVERKLKPPASRNNPVII